MQVAQRQQFRMRKVDGIAADLDGVLGRPDNGSANPYFGWSLWNLTPAQLIGARPDTPAEMDTQVPQVPLFVAIDKLRHSA